MMGWYRKLASAKRNRRGVAAAEFAIIAPIMVICLVAVYDLGRALQQQIRLNQAMQAGGLFAVAFPYSVTGIRGAVSTAVANWTDVTIATPQVICQCWNSVTSATFTMTSANCGFTSTQACGGTSVFRRYVSIGASRPFSPIFYAPLTTTSVQHVVQTQ